MAKIIDGKALAMKVREELKAEVERLKKKGITPGLAVVLLGKDPASQIYVRSKGKACDAAGIASFQHRLPAETTQEALLDLISQLNANKDVHGILVQLPLPSHMDADLVLEAIDPLKDVDGFHPYNVGKLMTGAPVFQPCTPLGIIKLLESTGTDLNGKDVVVIGRSNIVGKPIALMLLQRHATVTICHSRTKDLIEKMKRADIVVAAVGKAGIVTGKTIKEGAVIIDVGMNRNADGKLVGDVDFESAEKVASYITPVPGGVGPMTIAMLLHNTVEAAKRQQGLMN